MNAIAIAMQAMNRGRVRRLQEKYLGKKVELWIAFLDLEKAFDRVPREVVWWASKQMDVDGWLINAVKAES